MRPTLWIVVLVKDFSTAKSRLAPAMQPAMRRALAEMTAARALDAALTVAPTLAVCGSPEAADLALARGAAVVVEQEPGGQNPAAQLGLAEVSQRGAGEALVLSSDLPLVDAAGLRRLLARADKDGSVVVAAPAAGRQGTNALLLRPPGDFDLHFGEASLPLFAQEAQRRGRRFILHDDPSLALDLDEPPDLVAWRRLEPTA
jgi:2-phospho-L-lactate/phosphoenolpyruvate guanylyltransferase